MTIRQKISQSAELKKLANIFNTSFETKKGRFYTASQTTIDSRSIVLEVLENKTGKSVIYTNILSRKVEKYVESLKLQKDFSYKEIIEHLTETNFHRVEKVDNYGEFSLRGDTVTLWPSVYDHPIRISFWGENVESIDIIDEIVRGKLGDTKFIMIGDESYLENNFENESVKISNPSLFPANNFLFFNNTFIEKAGQVNFGFNYPTLFFNRLDLFKKEYMKRSRDSWKIYLSTNHHKQIRSIFRNNTNLNFVKRNTFKTGFENFRLRLAVYTDRELFGTIFISQEKAKSAKAVNKYLAQLEGEVEVGEYIVHEDYGIASYKGIEQKNVLGKLVDYFILEYAEGDKLSVPITQIAKLTKYIGADKKVPKITRLGKTNWRTIKKKVKKSIVFMAKELLKLYAKTTIAKTRSFRKHEWEDKFAMEFEFRETEDQTRAICEILSDLEKTHPMNRLLVGDVGFGKTEVAMRASFRTVMNEKQVAVLCPTTILVSQHNSVFSLRMKNYPIRIETLSRFGTKSQNAQIVKDIKDDKVNIVIGTHRLLSNDIKFADLGLLIIDEEQRFGVKQKEKIRKLSINTNVLTMSATPIPRTLSMALSSLRDISIITTPPPGRKPIKNYLGRFDWKKAVKAVMKEVERGGQVYFVHNEVKTIDSIKSKLANLMPDVRFKIAHGQMHPSTLAKIMRDFYKGKFDCLVCTTIIENGIDIKNVNTIIINKAERYGLAQLYQLRGRVGRGKEQAFCHLFYTHKNMMNDTRHMKEMRLKGKKISFDKARSRFNALMESQEVGSGFKIASRDLEIRGAGNLLGREQHGNISAIGLGLYTQLLAEEVEKLKAEGINSEAL